MSENSNKICKRFTHGEWFMWRSYRARSNFVPLPGVARLRKTYGAHPRLFWDAPLELRNSPFSIKAETARTVLSQIFSGSIEVANSRGQYRAKLFSQP